MTDKDQQNIEEQEAQYLLLKDQFGPLIRRVLLEEFGDIFQDVYSTITNMERFIALQSSYNQSVHNAVSPPTVYSVSSHYPLTNIIAELSNGKNTRR